MADAVRDLRAWRRARRPRVQSVQSRRVNPGAQAPVYELYAAGSPRLRDRSTTTSRRTSASRGSRTSRPGWLRRAARRSRRRPRCAPATASRTTVTASASTGTSTTAIPATRSRRTARRRARNSRWSPPASRGRCSCDSLSASGRRGDSGRAQLPDGDRLQQWRESVPSEFQDAVRPVVFGRLPAHDQPADGHRSAVRRHAARRRDVDRGTGTR